MGIVAGGRLVRFHTVMTGEMFSLLKEHSILSDLLVDEMGLDDAFRAGVCAGSRQCADRRAVLVRAGVLLGRRRKEDATDFTSGLLIGADIAFGLRDTSGTVYVMGRPELTRLYAAAIGLAGREAKIDGEAAFLAGIVAIAGQI